MYHRRWMIAIALTGAIGLSGNPVGPVSLAAQKKDDKKQDEAQKKEVQAVVKIVDDAATGQATPNDLSLSWIREDVLKAQGNKEYVPFVVTVDPTKVTGGTVAFYWRVVAKNGAPVETAATTGKADDKKDKDKDKDKDKKKTEYAYEDVSFIPVTAPAAGEKPGTMKIARSFTVPSGEYDVFVVAKEPASSQKNAPAPKTSVIKQTMAVPDFWNGDLNTSTVIVAQRIDPLPAPLTPQQQADRPYALGQMEIVPQMDMKFSKQQELSTFMLIYNPKTDKDNKPDVIVDYSFSSKSGNDWKFFNKTKPQPLNKETLPPQFDIAAGHQLQSGQAVPLATFPEGDYKLEITVTDKVANKTLTRDVFFTVTAS